jgi:2-polyprenyl-6-methoxyphenol hydroxylase-like FAD-dependent oxidoreductase
MDSPSSHDTDVLIVGAGPTGLVLGLWLTPLVCACESSTRRRNRGRRRALAVQARTLELYDQIGLADAVVERGRKAIAANLWVSGKKEGHVVFGDMGHGLSPFPYAIIFRQTSTSAC